MISWIQKYFHRHFRLVFVVILLAMAVPLIVIYSGSSGIGNADRKAVDVPFFGLNLSSQSDQQKLMGDAQLSIVLKAGYPALDGAQMQQYAFFRQASLYLAGELHIPAATPAQLTDHVKELRAFAGENGEFDAKRYNDFRANPQRLLGVTESEITRVLSDDVRVARVEKLLGGPGYVLAPDVKTQLERLDSLWTLGVATIDYKSYAPAINPTEADLLKFFEENPFLYQIPAKVLVRYAEFPATAYLPNVTVTEPEVRAFYDANPARFPQPDDKKAAPATPANPDADFAAVRPQVEQAAKADRAARLAARAAGDFTKLLFDKKILPGTPEFEALLAARGLALRDAPAISREEIPALFGNNPDVATEALKLNKDRLYSDPIAMLTGSFVLFFKDSMEARQPLFAEVKAKVSENYVEQEKRRRFVELGKTLRSQLQARLKAGDNFEKAATALAGSTPAKIEQKTYGPFSLRQRPQDVDYAALNAIETLEKGSVSEMIATQEKGLLVHAIEKKTPDVSEANPQYQATRAQFAQVIASRSGGEYLRELVEAELARTRPPQP